MREPQIALATTPTFSLILAGQLTWLFLEFCWLLLCAPRACAQMPTLTPKIRTFAPTTSTQFSPMIQNMPECSKPIWTTPSAHPIKSLTSKMLTKTKKLKPRPALRARGANVMGLKGRYATAGSASVVEEVDHRRHTVLIPSDSDRTAPSKTLTQFPKISQTMQRSPKCLKTVPTTPSALPSRSFPRITTSRRKPRPRLAM